MTELDDLSAMAVRLGVLRESGDHNAWDRMRRLAIVSQCCKRSPLIEVMNTDPPCVLLGQAAVSESALAKVASDEPRERWQGVGRDRSGRGIVWLSTFEQMTGTNLRHWLWCAHRRWYVSETPATRAAAGRAVWIPLDVVLSGRGRHKVSIEDTSGRMR